MSRYSCPGGDIETGAKAMKGRLSKMRLRGREITSELSFSQKES